jgi:dihydropteroate synthase type 2
VTRSRSDTAPPPNPRPQGAGEFARGKEVTQQGPRGFGTKILGIVNITEDSFSDGGRFLATDDAIAHARKLAGNGADVIDLGAASSNPDAKPVESSVEIARLAPVVAALKTDKILISVDTFAPEVQRWALAQDVDYLNDVRGFPFPDLYPDLAASTARLIVMHSVQGTGPAARVAVEPQEIFDRVARFFDQRFAALERAGVARSRLILDPGMGLFLGTRREASFEILRRLSELKARFGLPMLVSVSRKSFLRTFLDRAPQEAGPASLAAELYAAIVQGADFIRTHDPASLKDALAVWGVLGTKPNTG